MFRVLSVFAAGWLACCATDIDVNGDNPSQNPLAADEGVSFEEEEGLPGGGLVLGGDCEGVDDCDDGQVCHPMFGKCVTPREGRGPELGEACESNEDCEEDAMCHPMFGKCVVPGWGGRGHRGGDGGCDCGGEDCTGAPELGAECESLDDCEEGQVCHPMFGQCVTPPEGRGPDLGGACENMEDCEDGQICHPMFERCVTPRRGGHRGARMMRRFGRFIF